MPHRVMSSYRALRRQPRRFPDAMVSTEVANTFYINPNGNNGNLGSIPSAPWQTFDWAIPRLPPDSTLILQGGTPYTLATTGIISINGSHSDNVTLRAETERQVTLSSDGSVAPISITNQIGWSFHGIYAHSADNASSVSGEVMVVRECTGITIQKMIFRYPNRNMNSSCLLIESPTTGAGGTHLVEQCEFYDFHRYGLLTKYEANSVFRMLYANSRGRADLTIPTDPVDRGDGGYAIYPGSNMILENLISEGNGIGFEVEAENDSSNIQMLGCISIDDVFGAILRARVEGGTPIDTVMQHFLAKNPVQIGVYLRGARNAVLSNLRVQGAVNLGGVVADLPSGLSHSPLPSIALSNSLIQSNAGVGVTFVDQVSQSADHCASVGNGAGEYSPPASDPSITNEFTASPTNLGTDLTQIPGASNLSGAGSGGADIGCTIMFKYNNGTLTGNSLWTPTFNTGAIVTGVNDIAGSSAANVHTRLGK